MRVVLHYDADGEMTVYADDGVEVISVCDSTPQDRLYRLRNNPIPEGMIDGPIGSAGDGSAAETRVTKWMREFHGDLPFDVIDGGKG